MYYHLENKMTEANEQLGDFLRSRRERLHQSDWACRYCAVVARRAYAERKSPARPVSVENGTSNLNKGAP